MGRKAILARVVRGKPLSSIEFQRALVDQFAQYDKTHGGTVDDIFRDLEMVKTPQTYRMVYATITHMASAITEADQAEENAAAKTEGRLPRKLRLRAPLLRKVAHGRWVRDGAKLPSRDVSPAAGFQRQMEEVYERYGLFPRNRDLYNEFCCNPSERFRIGYFLNGIAPAWKSEEEKLTWMQNAEYERTAQATRATLLRLSNQPPFYRLGRGRSTMHDPKHSTAILHGRWIRDTIELEEQALWELNNTTPHRLAAGIRYFELLDSVGRAFAEALRLRNMIPKDLLDHKDMELAFTDWLDNCDRLPFHQTDNSDLATWDVENRGDRHGHALRLALAYRDSYEKGDEGEAQYAGDDRLALLLHFTHGFACAHATAPLSFHKAFSKIVGTDPMWLSRGVIRWTLTRLLESHIDFEAEQMVAEAQTMIEGADAPDEDQSPGEADSRPCIYGHIYPDRCKGRDPRQGCTECLPVTSMHASCADHP